MYNILRTKKIKSRANITEAAEHNFRTRTQPNIDKSRSGLNKILFNPMNVDTKKGTSLREALDEEYTKLGIKEKKDNVLMLEFVVSASPEFFENSNTDDWANHQLEFFKSQFGENLRMGVLHLDETTPHIHFMVSTEQKSVKKYKNQKGEFHKETYSLNAKRWDPKFLENLHTAHAEHNKRFGLARGQYKSKGINKPVKDYYKELSQIKKEMENKVTQVEMVPELISMIDILSTAIEELDPPNKQLARLARLATNIIGKKANGGSTPKTPGF